MLLILALAPAGAQDSFSPYLGDAVDVPGVSINSRSVSLQSSLFPEYYKTHSSVRDLRWVSRNDTSLVNFWSANGDRILGTLSELSGLTWQESEFDIHLLRFYPTYGNAEPMIVPIGGIMRGHLTQPMPSGARMQLNLVFQMAKRMLAQSIQPELDYYHPVANHPLMQPGPYRQDNLAMLLALVTAEQVIGLDSAYSAYQSAFWKQRHPGREIFEQYMLKEWILSTERPLVQWVLEEPYGSQLVAITRTPRPSHSGDSNRKLSYIEGLPLKGQLGFSVTPGGSNRLIVDKIDVERLAFACGLREQDAIRLVDGRRARNHKNLIELILASLEEGGATLQVDREGSSTTVLIRPLEYDMDDDSYFWDEQVDTLFRQVPPQFPGTPEVSPDTRTDQ